MSSFFISPKASQKPPKNFQKLPKNFLTLGVFAGTFLAVGAFFS